MKNKNSKARMQVIFGALLFTLVFMIELYGMINYPYMFIILAVIVGVDLVFLFVTIDGLMEMSDQKKARQEEQYDSVFKSEKASYLMLKKYFEEIEDKLNYLEKTAKIPTEEIINAQKGIGKVIINRNHENMDALMNAYDQLLEEVSQLKDEMGATEGIARNHTEEILNAQKNQGEETEKALQAKLQDLTVSLKDMELRLNNVIMQSQKVITQMPMMSAPMPQYSQQPPVQAAESNQSISEPTEQKIAESEPIVNELEPDKIETEKIEQNATPVEEEPKPKEVPEEGKQESKSEVVPEVAEEELRQEEIPETVVENTIIEEPKPEESPATEEKPPMPDLSDPNKNLSADEIAALFANMGGDSEPAPVKEEPKPEEVSKPEESPAAEEKSPMPDLSDPNKNLSADEIAALFANLGA